MLEKRTGEEDDVLGLRLLKNGTWKVRRILETADGCWDMGAHVRKESSNMFCHLWR